MRFSKEAESNEFEMKEWLTLSGVIDPKLKQPSIAM